MKITLSKQLLRTRIAFAREVAAIVGKAQGKDPRPIASTLKQYMASNQEAEKSPRRKIKRDVLLEFYRSWDINGAANFILGSGSYRVENGMTRRKFAVTLSEMTGIPLDTLKPFFNKNYKFYIPELFEYWEAGDIDGAIGYLRNVKLPFPSALDELNNGGKTKTAIDVIMRDVFFICRVPIRYYGLPIEFDRSFNWIDFDKISKESSRFFGKSKEGNKSFSPSFIVGSDVFFEVFGPGGAAISKKMDFWIRKLSKFVKIKYLLSKRFPNSLIKTASMLDNEVCSPQDKQCNSSLIDGLSFVRTLGERVKLLTDTGIPLCNDYLIFLEKMSHQDYTGTAEQIVNVPVMPLPYRSAASDVQIVTIPEIESQLISKGFESCNILPDVEKVALYFETPERLMSEIERLKSFDQEMDMPKAASSNWYIKHMLLKSR